MEIKQIKIVDLNEADYNPRKLSDRQFQKIKESIEGFGFVDPVIVNSHPDRKNIIIGGHQRCKVAAKIGIEEVPCVFVELDEGRERELNIRLNKNTGEWDFEALQDNFEIPDLIDWGFDVDDFEIKEEEGSGGEDPGAGEPPEEPQSELGTIYQLGRHRLMCGDSTSEKDVGLLMGGEKADMVFTSPPYNANTKAGDGDIFNGKKSKKLYSDGYSDNLKSNEYVDFVKKVLNICFEFTEGVIFWNVSYNANSRFEYILQITDKLEYLVDQICWKKSSTIPFKGSMMREWEPIYVFTTNKESLGLSDVVGNHWAISNTGSQAEDHKACFPIELPLKAIKMMNAHSIFEPFGGSGSTLIACEKTGRDCRMMELDPKYCDVIISRYAEMVGVDPQSIFDGKAQDGKENS